MRKSFHFTSPNKKPERQVEAIKYEVKKYIARERRKKLPEGVDFWDFDCKIGETAELAQDIHLNSINKSISQLFEENKPGLYLEILAKQGVRRKKAKESHSEDNAG